MKKLPEFSISFKRNHKSTPLVQIGGVSDAAKVCRSLYDKGVISWKEEFHVVALTRQNHVIGSFKVSEGGLAGTVLDPKVIFQFALLSNAAGIILTHNHPSGNLKTSEQDIRATKKIVRVCEDMDMKLLDHIIITEDGYLSMIEEGHI